MYTKMKRIKQGKAGLNYILNEAAHNNHEQRNEFVTGVNLMDGVSWYKQFQYYWNRSCDGHETQLRHLICSFSDRELDPKNQEDVRRAHELFTEYVQEYYPQRQIVVATQIDGKSGLVHCHAMVNDCDMVDTRGCSEQQRYYKFLMQTCNEFMKEHGVVLDRGRNHDVVSKKTYEQIYEIKCAEVEAQRTELAEQIDAATAAGDAEIAAKLQKRFDEIKDPYIWKEHLRQRIQEAKEEATSYDDFIDALDAKGVISDDTGKHNKFRLKKEEYARFTDKAYPEKAVCRGKTLNPEFSRDALKAYFDSYELEDEDEAQIEPVDELEALSSENADVELLSKQPAEQTVRRVGRRSTKKNYRQEIIEAENDECEDEDAALAAAGYAADADFEESSEAEADALERMRATIREVMRRGEAFNDDDFGEDEDDRSL